MSHDERLPARATSLEERSDSIVVSFGANWTESIRSRRFSVVIRKRVPTYLPCNWMYFHVNHPVGALFARAPITDIFQATLPQLLQMTSEIDLSPQEISKYVGSARQVGCYRLGRFDIAIEPLTTAALTRALIYHPPQSFFILAKAAKRLIDNRAGFLEPPARQEDRAR